MDRQVGGTGGRAAPGSGTDDRQLEREEGEARVSREEEGKRPICCRPSVRGADQQPSD